jgi:uncharacterized protein YoaH (UPF0181 family)
MPKDSSRRRRPATEPTEQGTTATAASLAAVLTAVLAQAITAVQARQVPAEQAIKAAMNSLGAAQKAGLEFLLGAVQAQARIARQLLDQAPAASRTLGSELSGLLVQAVERSPEILDSVASGFKSWLTAVAGPGEVRPEPPFGSSPENSEAPPSPEPSIPAETPPASKAKDVDTILAVMAEGYSRGQSGGEVAQTIRTRYPDALPDMQKYLAMDDFLVLLWLRQQPALAAVAGEEGFARFYAELKMGIMA